MRKENQRYIFSPSDLTVFLKSKFASWMDRLRLDHREECPEPDEPDASTVLVRDLGIAHECEFLALLRAQGKDICEIADGDDKFEKTLEAMHRGHEVIYQAWLQADEFAGAADFLVKVEGASALGDYHYEPWDTKLALSAKPYFIIQLLSYAEMIERVQNRLPVMIRVVTGKKELLNFRVEDFVHFYRKLKRSFLDFQSKFDRLKPPDPSSFEDLGRWTSQAEKIISEKDDLSLVASITRSQMKKLRAAGISTMTALSEAPSNFLPPGLDKVRFAGLQLQSQLQISSADCDRPKFKVLTASDPCFDGIDPTDPDAGPRRGLYALPPSCVSDVAFDMEGYPFHEGGLEYLFGVSCMEGGTLVFKDWWAHNSVEEKKAFEGFIDWLHDRWLSDPDLHVYHYGDYEVSAVKRLMSRYGCREDKVDDLLRNGVFVNLYRIVGQGLKVGEPKYSLKNIEHLYRDKRAGDVATAAQSVVEYQRWLSSADGATWQTSEILKGIRDYNEEDCVSTWQLADWLREQAQRAGICGGPTPGQALPVPPLIDVDADDEDCDSDESNESAVSSGPRLSVPRPQAALVEKLLAELPLDRSVNEEHWRLQELFAWLLEFHQREMRPVFWQRYHWHEMSESELYNEIECLAGLVLVADSGRPKNPKNPRSQMLYDYTFDPDQETKLAVDDKCYNAATLKAVEIVEMDHLKGTITLSISANMDVPARLSLIPEQIVRTKSLEESILRTVSNWHETGQLPQALEDFLQRRRPRITGNESGDIVKADVLDVLNAQINAITNLSDSALCAQGPPGSGKTFVASKTIVELLRAGKRVGIASNSHEAVINLIERVLLDARNERVAVLVAKSPPNKKGHRIFDNDNVKAKKPCHVVFDPKNKYNLFGGTAWDFAPEEMRGQLDYLFVDEAGQVSLANLVAMAPCAKNLVFLGDQMQLSQPLKGSHPGESGTSILDYLLGNKPTIPADLGIFLSTTRRLHPEICKFISDSIYESRLDCAEHTANRKVLPAANTKLLTRGQGILFVETPHEGNVQSSDEEVEAIACLYDELLASYKTDEFGNKSKITAEDILIVAPYNMQVRKLAERLPQAKIGSVDKFQGKEAAVVIVSMCSSEANGSARGLDFLFSSNRLNVALSRAQSLAVVVGNPGLAETNCKTPEQMKLVNLFCKIMAVGSAAKDAAESSRSGSTSAMFSRQCESAVNR
jgi:predicted RecB family nuclease